MFKDTFTSIKNSTKLKGLLKIEYHYSKIRSNDSEFLEIYSELIITVRLFNIILSKKRRHKNFKLTKYYNSINKTDKFGNEFKLNIGDKVLHKTESNNIEVVEIMNFDDLKGKYGGKEKALPIIKDNKNNITITFGVVIPYNKKLEKILKMLSIDEQLNFLSRDHYKMRNCREYLVNDKDSIIQWYKNNAKLMYK